MDSQNFSHSHFSYCKWCCYEQTSQDSAFNSFDSEIQVLNNMIILFLIFCNRHFDLHRSYIILHSHQQNRRVQFSPHTCQYFFVLHCFSVAKSCPTLCNPMGWSTPGFPVLHYSLSFWVCSNFCPLSWWCHQIISSSYAPIPPALNLSQYQSLFQWVGSLHQVAKVLELQHESFQWIFRVDFL